MTIKHGANLFDLAKELHIEKSSIMDFSSNINPFGSSVKAKKAVAENMDAVSIYPDPDYVNLKKSISEYASCSPENIILGSGATELISKYISFINPKNALLICPAYSEYERELNKHNCNIYKYLAQKEKDFKIDIHDLVDTINNNHCDFLILCNPNNPTGFAFTNEEVKFILSSTSCYVMVDETYVEFTDKAKYSCSQLIDSFSKLFVIRGTSKFFSTPGIRLGYALLSDKDVHQKIQDTLDLWNINIFASMMGEIMFVDNDFISSTVDKIKKERDYLTNSLKSLNGVKVYDSFGNFILCEISSKAVTSASLYDSMTKKGIIIRDCSSFGLGDYFFRVCVLKHDENEKLIAELTKALS